MNSNQILALPAISNSRIIKADDGFVYHVPANSPGSDASYLGESGKYIDTTVDFSGEPDATNPRWNRSLASFPLQPNDLLTGNEIHFLLEMDLKFEFLGPAGVPLEYYSGENTSGFAVRLCLDEHLNTGTGTNARVEWFTGGLAIYDINPFWFDRRITDLKVKTILRPQLQVGEYVDGDLEPAPAGYHTLASIDQFAESDTDGSRKTDFKYSNQISGWSGISEQTARGIKTNERALLRAWEFWYGGRSITNVDEPNSVNVQVVPLSGGPRDAAVTGIRVGGYVSFKKIKVVS